MDNEDLERIVNLIPELKFKFVGSFSASTFIVPTRPNTFVIVNVDSLGSPGEHWITIGNKDGVYFYGDSLGKPIKDYPNVKFQLGNLGWHYKQFLQLNHSKLQVLPLCGLYSIYFAWKMFGNIAHVYTDFDLLRLFCKLL